MLSDYPAETLHETIVNFHNTVSRFADFKKAVEEDVCGRAKEVEAEIKFIMEREQVAHIICDALEEKRIPLRVTHNDTKHCMILAIPFGLGPAPGRRMNRTLTGYPWIWNYLRPIRKAFWRAVPEA